MYVETNVGVGGGPESMSSCSVQAVIGEMASQHLHKSLLCAPFCIAVRSVFRRHTPTKHPLSPVWAAVTVFTSSARVRLS